MKLKFGPLSMLSNLSKLVRDERGHILLMFTIMAPVMLGITGLALEGGRLFMLHSELQNLADAAALAGAKELDGANDAITRATDKARNLLTNDTWWSSIAESGIQILDLPTFYSALAGDTDPVTGRVQATDVVTTDPTQANYIKVVTVTRDVVPMFLVAVGATTTNGKTATATAGSTFVICNVQPLMLCNPYGSNFANNVHVGDLFGFTAQGQSSYTSGDFNLLDPAGQTHSGARILQSYYPSHPLIFVLRITFLLVPAQASGPVSNGINVRFDIAPNPVGGLDTTPAPAVIKGSRGGSCSNPQLTNDSDTAAGRPHALPLNINASTTTPTGNSGSTFMSGTFDTTRANQYWRDHHNATGSWPSDPTSGQPLTRYQVYQNERNNVYSWIIGENPAPSCNPPAGTDNRRKISVAILDCDPPLAGNSIKSIRSNSYANFFLVRPVIQVRAPLTAKMILAPAPSTVTPLASFGPSLSK